jgi:DNA polymerase I-like protein with 3'-5' exonuclease and polymerase domains
MFTGTAQIVLQVTPEQRSHAKRLAYGLLYGMGPSALAAGCAEPCALVLLMRNTPACMLPHGCDCPHQVTPEQRSHAKRLAYGLLYGMGPSALAADLGVSMGQAIQLADDFRRSHPGLDAWIKVGRAAACCRPCNPGLNLCAAIMLHGC